MKNAYFTILIFLCPLLLTAQVSVFLKTTTPTSAALGYNTAIGTNTLKALTTGEQNTASGYDVLKANTSGWANTANGYQALFSNTTGHHNAATGMSALYSNISGYNNVANGVSALYANTTGFQNTATGVNALNANTNGKNNTAYGAFALESNTSGINNVATGMNALNANTTGFQNTATGILSLYTNTTGSNNTAYGSNALYSNISGTNNTAMGFSALISNTKGSNNTAIGYLANVTTGALNNTTAIGYGATVSVDNGLVLGQIGTALIGIGTSTPQSMLHVVCARDREIRFENVLEGSGFILVVDDRGFVRKSRQTALTGTPTNTNELLIRVQKEQLEAQKAQIESLQNQINDIKQLLSQKNKTENTTYVSKYEQSIELKQNSPNPANGTTQIDYYIPQTAQNVVLSIFDLTGKRLQMHPLQTTGKGSINIQTSDLVKGMYIYTLTINGQEALSKKMLVLGE
jgi:trimeric autotransporter adhesin